MEYGSLIRIRIKRVARDVVTVPRLISAFEKSFENAHGNHAPFG